MPNKLSFATTMAIRFTSNFLPPTTFFPLWAVLDRTRSTYRSRASTLQVLQKLSTASMERTANPINPLLSKYLDNLKSINI